MTKYFDLFEKKALRVKRTCVLSNRFQKRLKNYRIFENLEDLNDTLDNIDEFFEIDVLSIIDHRKALTELETFLSKKSLDELMQLLREKKIHPASIVSKHSVAYLILKEQKLKEAKTKKEKFEIIDELEKLGANFFEDSNKLSKYLIKYPKIVRKYFFDKGYVSQRDLLYYATINMSFSVFKEVYAYKETSLDFLKEAIPDIFIMNEKVTKNKLFTFFSKISHLSNEVIDIYSSFLSKKNNNITENFAFIAFALILLEEDNITFQQVSKWNHDFFRYTEHNKFTQELVYKLESKFSSQLKDNKKICKYMMDILIDKLSKKNTKISRKDIKIIKELIYYGARLQSHRRFWKLIEKRTEIPLRDKALLKLSSRHKEYVKAFRRNIKNRIRKLL